MPKAVDTCKCAQHGVVNTYMMYTYIYIYTYRALMDGITSAEPS